MSKAKKTLLRDRHSIIKSAANVVNNSLWFSLKYEQYGYTSVVTIFWSHDKDTLVRVRFLASVQLIDEEGVDVYYTESLSLINITEIRPAYNTADRVFRPSNLKAAELLPLFIEFEGRYNKRNKQKPISLRFHQRILKQLSN